MAKAGGRDTGTPGLVRMMTYRSTEESEYAGASGITTRRESRMKGCDCAYRHTPLREIEGYERDSDALSELYKQRAEACQQLLSRLDVSARRHSSLLSYFDSLDSDLSSTKSLALSDLESRYNAAQSRLTALYRSSLHSIELTVKEKQQFLSEKKRELEWVLKAVDTAKRDLELRLKTETKAGMVERGRDHLAEARTALEYAVADIEVPGNFLMLFVPELRVESATMSRGETIHAVSSTSGKRGSAGFPRPSFISHIQNLEISDRDSVRLSLPAHPLQSPTRYTPKPAVTPTADTLFADIENRCCDLQKYYETKKRGKKRDLVALMNVQSEKLTRRVE